jgi:very-short-patch-repair endonuclease
MRKAPAATERLLWRLLRDKQVDGLKFRRQVPLGPYIADFACMRHRIVIEADGPFHDAEGDAKRDA